MSRSYRLQHSIPSKITYWHIGTLRFVNPFLDSLYIPWQRVNRKKLNLNKENFFLLSVDMKKRRSAPKPSTHLWRLRKFIRKGGAAAKNTKHSASSAFQDRFANLELSIWEQFVALCCLFGKLVALFDNFQTSKLFLWRVLLHSTFSWTQLIWENALAPGGLKYDSP